MGKPTLDDLLSVAREGLHDENIVTLLGESDSGKTVVLTLLKHALFHKFVPFHGGKFEAVVVKGGEDANAILEGMRMGGSFPSATIPGASPQIELEIHKMSGEGAGKIKLMLQDRSGENYMELLQQEFDDPRERLEHILTNNRTEDIGPLVPYVFSKVYLLVIECPDSISNWDVDRTPSAIHALRQIHRVAKLTQNDKVRTHIALLFTKSDKLKDDDRNKSGSELLKHIPELESALKIVHGGKLECFKLSIDVEDESPQDKDQRVARLRQLADEKLVYEQREYDQRLKRFVEKNAAGARQEAESEYTDEETIEQFVQEAESEAKQRFVAMNKKPELDFEEEKEDKIKQKVTKDFVYSEDEYVRLIDWIIERLYD